MELELSAYGHAIQVTDVGHPAHIPDGHSKGVVFTEDSPGPLGEVYDSGDGRVEATRAGKQLGVYNGVDTAAKAVVRDAYGINEEHACEWSDLVDEPPKCDQRAALVAYASWLDDIGGHEFGCDLCDEHVVKVCDKLPVGVPLKLSPLLDEGELAVGHLPTITITKMDVSPAQAAAWVATATPGYWLSAFRVRAIDMFAGMMKRGQWEVQLDKPIAIGRDGRLTHGLCRLLAVLASGKTIRFAVEQGGKTRAEYESEVSDDPPAAAPAGI